jgi:transposase
MRVSTPISKEQVAELEALLNQVETIAEYRRLQSVWLRATLHLTPEQIATAVRLKPATVRQLHSAFLRHGGRALLGPGRGGRRHEYLPVAAERELIESFRQQAESGHVPEIREIKAAYEARVGHPVHKTTVYRMLDRHGWRKIVPRPRHPKGNPEAQEAFKKLRRRRSRVAR